ncbi:hypothetical protein QJQ45_030206, partial [Haematococcus lacustris]
VLEEHEREKHDWQQQQQDWQQQHQDWQQRQEDWQQQQQLMEKQLHDLLQQADLHAHIVAISAANELAQLKEQLNVAQARLLHQASGAEQLQQSVVKLTTAVCTADDRAIAAEASSIAAAAVAAAASSAAHASAALLEQEQQLNAALLEETERLHQHVAIADAATMAAMADAEDKGVRLRACMADSKQLQIECSNLMKRVARRDQALQELRAAQTAQTATAREQEQSASNCQHPSSRPHQTVLLCHTQVAAHATAAYKTSYLLRALQLLVACQLSFNKVQHAITSSLGIHLMPGQELIDRVPSGKTLKRAMDKIVETVNVKKWVSVLLHSTARVTTWWYLHSSLASNAFPLLPLLHRHHLHPYHHLQAQPWYGKVRQVAASASTTSGSTHPFEAPCSRQRYANALTTKLAFVAEPSPALPSLNHPLGYGVDPEPSPCKCQSPSMHAVNATQHK